MQRKRVRNKGFQQNNFCVGSIHSIGQDQNTLTQEALNQQTSWTGFEYTSIFQFLLMIISSVRLARLGTTVLIFISVKKKKKKTDLGFLRDFFANSSITTLKSSFRNFSCSIMFIRVSMTRCCWHIVNRNCFLIRASFENERSPSQLVIIMQW